MRSRPRYAGQVPVLAIAALLVALLVGNVLIVVALVMQRRIVSVSRGQMPLAVEPVDVAIELAGDPESRPAAAPASAWRPMTASSGSSALRSWWSRRSSSPVAGSGRRRRRPSTSCSSSERDCSSCSTSWAPDDRPGNPLPRRRRCGGDVLHPSHRAHRRRREPLLLRLLPDRGGGRPRHGWWRQPRPGGGDHGRLPRLAAGDPGRRVLHDRPDRRSCRST